MEKELTLLSILWIVNSKTSKYNVNINVSSRVNNSFFIPYLNPGNKFKSACWFNNKTDDRMSKVDMPLV